jgi:hypothetical protein
MVASLVQSTLDSPVLAACVWSTDAIFFYESGCIGLVDSWVQQNDFIPTVMAVWVTLTSPVPEELPGMHSEKQVALTPSMVTIKEVETITRSIMDQTHTSESPVAANDTDNVMKDDKLDTADYFSSSV